MVVRFLLVVLSLIMIGNTCVYAKNCHNNGRYNKCGLFSSSRYSYYDCDDDDCYKKHYKRWAKRCNKYKGCNCSYDFWYGNRDWDDDDWDNYWDSDLYRNARKVGTKVNTFRRIMNSTRDLFTW